ncbi:MAG: hypothetical protein JXQ82_07270 [Methanomicrobiaceae archaeon]|nr:hypothetical protein [Methanomicrobiaceae archaeon]
MNYSKREVVIIFAGLVAIGAGVINIATGVSQAGLYLYLFIVVMFAVVIGATVWKHQKEVN